MSRAGPQLRNFARRLIAYEARANDSRPKNKPDAFEVCDRLRPQLVTLMGTGGFHALLCRALALASAEVSWLSGAHVKPDGTLGDLEEIQSQLAPQALLAGTVVLLAELLGLLVTFIGKNLTLSLVREAWPKASLNDLKLANDDKNEKTK